MDQQQQPDGQPQQPQQVAPSSGQPQQQPQWQSPPQPTGGQPQWQPQTGYQGSTSQQPPQYRAPAPQQPQYQAPPQQQPRNPASPSAPPAGWQGDHATYLQTVPTAVYQAPSQGGYAMHQQDHSPAPAVGTGRSTWSLVTGLLGLVISIFVGWGFPLSIAAIVLGFVARRREPQGRGRALTGIVTGFVGLLCSAGWLAYSVIVIIGYVST